MSEAINRVIRDGDVTRNAEMVAMSEAQRGLGTKRLSRCTLYTNVEPLRYVLLLHSRDSDAQGRLCNPLVHHGGHSRWTVLQDKEISYIIPEVFGRVPEIAGAVMRQ